MHISALTIHQDRFPAHDVYPFSVPSLAVTPRIDFIAPITFFIGENGSGKSTLLQAIARRCNIHIWQEMERGRFQYNRYEERFCEYIEVAQEKRMILGSFFSSDNFRHFTQNLDEWASMDPGVLDYFGGKSLYTMSHGQSLISFFRTRYAIEGLYLLDEPETALSPRRLIELLAIVRDMATAGHAQFIIATHSPLLLACPGAIIYNFDTVPVSSCSYEETDYFRVYKDFMEHREKYLG
ncbi:MAG: AAA family ATPase [Candidatus Raymondbacteria bacterium RifOxyA12_full_50_37]|uniref:AAA family ATPase n=1 Tax=Candidatus Raymondbacteria bacterium RIFOXYD12_FULL_49_13 TaxID=1817890 RepID=A0A1F7FEF3_UNCRA|nr:MAG: AAA family ATPase [Candidatus Raymondbacteria bacterium RifOxyB12_full_50_8]OGJ89826.1 MAG: AAA family ATPase [Candidatus Raymondbacteria bacterium RifOxyA12_full_50_37]OGJ91233.1 MAG: AAA family ATPase [Candidatus Raymondbacteria bacterium RIFOXYA2_FULL_49_16]OGJ96320.1 MAG: AAA family ATPase [Candidatus Raymondbacteria bacterium RifOxyC12_full_50_8]OGJ97632.1 MAG: AAA family ATPase [Candidatus Raymondbacteria bacterium RIFOXYC2_FULL_50_21]OGK05069.1 MAG: AAA family ATPase [Candidatus